MKVSEIKNLAERQPFQPFTIRLSNGTRYTFREARNIGAPKDYHVIFFFGESQWALIDSESIVEVIARERC